MTWGMIGAGAIGLVGGYMSQSSSNRQQQQSLQAQQQGTYGQQAAVNQAYASANWLGEKGVYKGPITAGWRPENAKAGQMAYDSEYKGADSLNTAASAGRQAMGFQPQNVTAQNGNTWTGDQFLGKYMNPFISQVGGGMASDAMRARQIQIQGDEDKALAAGAYGGSRHGVADAETTRGFNDVLQKNLTGLYADGFKTAAGLGMQDAERFTTTDRVNADRRLASDQGNQRAGIEGARVRLDGGRLNFDVGNSQHANFLRSQQAVAEQGRYAQAYDQAALDRDKSLWDEWRDIPVRQSNLRTAAAGGGSVSAMGGPNSYQSFMNGAGSAVGMYGMARDLWGGGSYGSPNQASEGYSFSQNGGAPNTDYSMYWDY